MPLTPLEQGVRETVEVFAQAAASTG